MPASGERGAEHQVRAFHERFEEPYREQGLSDDQVLGRALSGVGVQVTQFCRRLNDWIYGRHFETYATYHRMEHVELALETAELHRRAVNPDAAVFADLSGYTALTDGLAIKCPLTSPCGWPSSRKTSPSAMVVAW